MSDKELQKQFDYHQLNNVMLHDKPSDADREIDKLRTRIVGFQNNITFMENEALKIISPHQQIKELKQSCPI